MIGWLQGELAQPWQQDRRCGLLLVCQGVGYEVQVSARQWRQLPGEGSRLALHIHPVVREDGWTLYGFQDRRERELFRELVAVSGVGPQMALGLLGCLELSELVRAIVQADLRRLCLAPGVGRRTAERLAVELRSRLQQRFLDGAEGAESDADEDGTGPLSAGPGDDHREEVQLTLAALGYEVLEIHRALRAVGSQGEALEGGSAWMADDWIRECLRWLAREAA
jgi:Holliday junction DNA helicase RuvA